MVKADLSWLKTERLEVVCRPHLRKYAPDKGMMRIMIKPAHGKYLMGCLAKNIGAIRQLQI